MDQWPFWLGGLALCGVLVGHWLLLQRMMAVSGRFTTLVDRILHGKADTAEMSQEELLAAVRAATAEAFGEGAATPAAPPAEPVPLPDANRQTPLPLHFLFFGGLILGGVVSAALAGGLVPAYALRSTLFASFFGTEPWVAPVVLVAGGMLVGFGTRMAGGCTTGHGLCGVSRFQVGSLVSTLGFFGAGVATSLLLEVLR